MSISNYARRGKESSDVDKHNFEEALKAWRKADPKNRHNRAIAVLSNVAAMKKKLADLVDSKTAQDIRFDAQQSGK